MYQLIPKLSEGYANLKRQKIISKFKKENPKILHFLAPLDIWKNSMFDKEAEIWHIYSPHILGVACKILGKSDEVFGLSITKCPKESKNA